MISAPLQRLDLEPRVRVSVVSAQGQSVWLSIPTGQYRELNTHEVVFPAGKRIVVTTTVSDVEVIRQTHGLTVIGVKK